MTPRQLARGQPCMIRLPGCDGGGESTVLAHFRMLGISGMGMKSPDLIGAYACYSCHQRVDSDKSPETQLDFAKGVFRTQQYLLDEGKIVWK